jgi:hypothetical protein
MKKRTTIMAIIFVVAALFATTSQVFGTGSRTTGVILQNIDEDGSQDATVLLSYYNQSGTVVATQEAQLAQYAALGFNAGSVSGLGSGFVGSMVVSSNKKVGAVSNDTDDTSVGMYNGFTEGGTEFYLPALYKGAGGWSTEIWVQATGDVPAGTKAYLVFMDRQGNQTGTTKDVDMTSQATVKVSPDDYSDIPSGWAGGVVISSTQNIAAIGRITNGSITEMYNGFANGDSTVYGPALYKNAGGWYSGIMVQNVGVNTTTVSIDFYDRLGAKTGTYNFANEFVAKGVQAINTRNVSVLPSGWAGTAVIKSNNSEPIIAVIDVTNSGAGLGNMYNAGLESDASTEAYVPAQYYLAGGWTAGTIAMNIDPISTTITYEYYDRNTQSLTTSEDQSDVDQYIAFALNTAKVSGLPAGWAGAVKAKTDNTSRIIVVANITQSGKSAFYSAFPKK